jgi:predicted Zn-dependent peptidase
MYTDGGISLLFFCTLLALSTILGSADAESQDPGQQYSPPGLYEPEIYELDNGLRVILKSRRHIHSVSIRAVVDVGSAYYPCGKQQIPHFLEHMLFAAHPEMSESELEQMMFNMGAKSNAVTEERQTVYQFSVYSQNTLVVLNALSKILFAGELAEDSFRLTRDIIKRESGGNPNYYERWLEKTDQEESAGTFAIRDISLQQFGVCPGRDTGSKVTMDQVQDAYNRYYDPDNATLIMVGDFTIEEGKNWIQTMFGKYQSKGEIPQHVFEEIGSFEKERYEGVSKEPGVGVIAKTEGYLDTDFYTLSLLQHYLENRMYHRLRIETGLTYTPSVDYYVLPDIGFFYLYAAISKGSHHAALDIIQDELGKLKSAKLDADAFESARTSLLLEWAKSTETNNAFADYYSDSLSELTRYGRFRNEEVAVASLTPDDFQRVARKVFGERNHVELLDDSFNDKVQLVVIVAICFMALMITIVVMVVVRHNRRMKRIRSVVRDEIIQ